MLNSFHRIQFQPEKIMSYINSYIRRSIYKTQKFNQNIQNVNMRKENKTTVECRCVEVEGTCYFSSDQQSF